MRIFFSTLTTLLISTSIFGAETLNPNWVPVNSGTSQDLHTVEWQNPTNVWAVGNGGTILKSSDQGKSWTPSTIGTSENLLSIAWNEYDEPNGIITGENGALFYTLNSGDSWNAAIFNSGSGTETFTDVAFDDQGKAVAVTLGAQIYRSDDGGHHWDHDGDFSGITPNLHCVIYDQGWGIYAAGGDDGKVLIDMVGWFDEDVGGSAIRDIDNSNGDILAGGDGGQMFEFNEGFTPYGANVPDDIRGLSGDEGHVYAVAKDGKLYAKQTGYPTFERRHTSIAADLNSVDFSNEYGVAVGLGGAIIRTEQNGLCIYSDISFNVTPVSCFGGNDGQIELTATNISEPIFNWSNSSEDQDISGLSAGVYSVTIEDGPCVYFGSTTVNEPASAVQIVNTGFVDPTCIGDVDGSIDMTVSGGTPGYSYSWNTGETTEDISNIGKGQYTLTAYDANGCSELLSVTISDPDPVISSTSGPQVICAGNNTTINVTGGTSYVWSPAGSLNDNTLATPTATPTEDTYYSVTATDASGCTGMSGVFVGVHAAPQVGAGSGIICVGDVFNLQSQANYIETDRFDFGEDQSSHNFSYSKPQGGPTELQACFNGVTSAYGDKSIDLGNALEGAATLELDVNVPIGTDDVKIRLKALGDNLTGVQVTLDNGPSLQLPANASCDWQALDFSSMASYTSDGMVQVSITHVGSPVNEGVCAMQVLGKKVDGSGFEWFNGSMTSIGNTQNINVSPASTEMFTVELTDGNGCKSSTTASVTVNALPTIDAGVDQDLCDGDIAIMAGSGTATTYMWTSTGTGFFDDDSDLNTGYTETSNVTITLNGTDGNGCSNQDEMLLTFNPLPSASAGPDEQGCEGSGFTVNASGGTTYSWDDASNLSATNIASPAVIGLAGAYTFTVTVTDANGCSATDQVDATVYNNPVVSVDDAVICDGDSHAFDAGAGFTGYAWSTTDNTQNVTLSTAGTYTVTVTDINGCEAQDDATLTVNANPTPTLSDAQICDGDFHTFDAGAGYAAYMWSTGESTQTVDHAVAGTYSVTVGDANGCYGQDAATLTVNTNPVPVIEDAQICDGESYNLDAGTFPAYNWSTAEVTQSIAVSVAGTYSVTVTDANGCQGQDDATMTVYNNPVVSVDDAAICDGDSHTFDAGAGFSAYNWSTTANSQTIGVGVAGTYTVTVTDVNGCEGQDAATLTVNTNPAPTVADGEICDGDMHTFDAGAGYAAYMWSTGETTQTVDQAVSGTYTVTVGDANGCYGQTDASLTVNANPTTSGTNDYTICAGEDVTFALGSAPGTYVWSPTTGLSDPNVLNPTAAPTTTTYYTVTVTDGNGCMGTYDVDVNVNNNPTPSLGSYTICAGENATFDAGTYPSYNWSTGQTTQTISATTAGAYVVTVTDVNGCQGQVGGSLTVNNLPIVAIFDDAICDGSSTTFDPGVLSSYAWSTGETTQSIVATTAGTYAVTGTDANGCSASSSATLTVNTPPVIDLQDTTICGNDVLTLDPGAGYSAYNWSTGAVTQTIAVSLSNTYGVTVTDANGCEGQAAMLLSLHDVPVVNMENDTVCQGGSTTFDAGTFTSFIWSTGATTQVISASTAGTYAVTVTDGNGCSDFGTTNLIINSNPFVLLTNPNICDGQSETVDAGPGYVSYNWSTGATTQTIDLTTAGTYGVTVTDDNGCVGGDDVTATILPSPTPTLSDEDICQGEAFDYDPGSFTTYNWSTGGNAQIENVGISGPVTVTVTDVNGCEGSATGILTVHALPVPMLYDTTICPDGQATFDPGTFDSYAWSFGSNQETAIINSVENFTVTVTDEFGCEGSAGGSVQLHSANSISLSNAVICEGESHEFNPFISADSYLWSNGATTATISVGEDDDYSVSATYANGCMVQDMATLTVNDVPVFELGADPVLCQGQTELVEADPSPMPNNPSYLWNTGATTAAISVDAAQLYSVTVTDLDNGCSYADLVFPVVLNNPTIELSAGDICPGGEGFVKASHDEDVTIDFTWTPGGLGDSIPVTMPGMYVVSADVQENGCQTIDSIAVTMLSADPIDLGMDTTVCDGGSVELMATAGFDNYMWSTGATTASISANGIGQYSVTATNSQGCSSADTINVTIAASIEASIIADATAICDGEQTTLNVGEGYLYQWSNGGTFADNTIDQPGTYSVTLTDENGCTGVDTITIDAKPGAGVDLGPDMAICPIGTTTLSANATGSFLWSTGATTESIDIDQPGTYYVDVTDECQGSDTIVVTLHDQPTFAIADQTACSPADAVLMGPAGFVAYQWSTGATDKDISVQPTDTTSWFLDVWDDNGCIASDTITVNVVPALTPALSDTAICFGTTYDLDPGSFATYQWHNSAATQVLSGTAFLTFTASVTVTDDNGCAGQASAEVFVSSDMSVDITSTNASCFQAVNGTATANVTGGTAPFSYFWNNGNINQTADSLRAEQYSVLVSDSIGCQATAVVDITQPEKLVLSETELVTNTTCGESNGMAVLGIAGGTLPYQFQWSNGATNQQIVNVPAGVYFARVQDSKGCKDSLAIAIIDIDGPVVDIDSVYHSSCSQPDGHIFTTVTGIAPFTFEWTNGSEDQDQANLYPGQYGMKVTDGNGCIGGAKVVVETDGVFRPVVQGNVFSSLDESAITAAKVTLIEYTQEPGVLPRFRSAQVDSTGAFEFSKVWVGEYILLVTPDTVFFPNTFKTFFPNVPRWDSAAVFSVNCSDTTELEVFVKKKIVLNGKARITGQITKQLKSELFKTGRVTGDPIPGVDVSLEQVPGGVVAQTQTDEDGLYQFDNVPAGEYQIFVDIPGLPMEQTYDVTIPDAEEDTAVVELDFLVDTTQSIYIEPTVDAVVEHLEFDGVQMDVYPNPFKHQLTIQYELDDQQEVYLEITNVMGQTLEILTSGTQPAGPHTINFNALEKMHSGIVLVRGYIGQQAISKAIVRQK